MKITTTIFLALLFVSCNNDDTTTKEEKKPPVHHTPIINYNPVITYPHDTTSFTEGFLVHEGKLYESTGYTDEFPQTRSLFGVVDLKTGKIDKKVELDKNKYFGEGIVFLNGKVYQLTYQTKIGFIYDDKTFKQLNTFTFPTIEGWGMTTDSVNIIMSDGTSNLTYLDSSTLKPLKILSVQDENGPVVNVNELEFIKGFIYANLYSTNFIIKIDPATGNVISKLDLSLLADVQKAKYPGCQEMNGIAYDPVTDKIYVTGKMWPNIYEIQFDH